MKGFLRGVRGIILSPCPKQVKIIGKNTEAAALCFLKLFLLGFLPGLGLFYLPRRFPVLIGCLLYTSFLLAAEEKGAVTVARDGVRRVLVDGLELRLGLQDD